MRVVAGELKELKDLLTCLLTNEGTQKVERYFCKCKELDQLLKREREKELSANQSGKASQDQESQCIDPFLSVEPKP